MNHTETSNPSLKVNRKEFPQKIISCLEAYFSSWNRLNQYRGVCPVMKQMDLLWCLSGLLKKINLQVQVIHISGWWSWGWGRCLHYSFTAQQKKHCILIENKRILPAATAYQRIPRLMIKCLMHSKKGMPKNPHMYTHTKGKKNNPKLKTHAQNQTPLSPQRSFTFVLMKQTLKRLDLCRNSN